MERPIEALQPIQLHLVQFKHWDATDIGPGTVLERIVIEELAA